jgi:hypothetical protein
MPGVAGENSKLFHHYDRVTWMQYVDFTAMTYTANYTYDNGTRFYHQIAILAEADFYELDHFKYLLGNLLSKTLVGKYRMDFRCYPTLFECLPAYYAHRSDINMTDELEYDNLKELHNTAINRFIKLYGWLNKSSAYTI